MKETAMFCNPNATKKPFEAGNRLTVHHDIFHRNGASFSAIVYPSKLNLELEEYNCKIPERMLKGIRKRISCYLDFISA